MYAGKPVETGTVDDVFYRPRMPYTLGLLGSLPRARRRRARAADAGRGQPAVAGRPAAGCPFAPRCPLQIDVCEVDRARAAADRRPRPREPPATAPRHRPRTTSSRPTCSPRPIAAARRRPRPRANGARSCSRSTTSCALPAHPRARSSAARSAPSHAVDGISFDIREGETLGLVGESGCGKTTTINEILALAKPTGGIDQRARPGHGDAVDRASGTTMRRDVSVVFQDPMASLDPRLPIGDILGEAAVDPRRRRRRQRTPRVRELLAPGRAVAGARQPLPARVLRRAAPAHRHRPGAGARTEAGRPRRAGLGARRVDPGRRHQPARAAAGHARPVVPVRRPRPVGRAPHRRPRRGDVPGAHRRDRRRRRRSSRGRRTRTRRRCCRRSRCPTRSGSAHGKRIILQGDLPSPAEARVGLPVPGPLPDVRRARRDRQSQRASTIDPALTPHGDRPRGRLPLPASSFRLLSAR